MSNKIFMKNMMFYGFHGVYEYEREQGQRFYVDAEICADLTLAGSTDNMLDTIDYTAVYTQIKEIMENQRFKLLEALSTHIAEDILTTTVATEVTIKVRKPGVAIPGPLDYVEVETNRVRKS